MYHMYSHCEYWQLILTEAKLIPDKIYTSISKDYKITTFNVHEF